MSKKHDLVFIRKSFKADGYILLTDHYINNKQRLEYICSKGHRGKIAWNHWQEGHRCLSCVPENNSVRFRMSFERIKESFEQDQYILLTDSYINAHQQLFYICPKRHKHSMTWNNWNKGYRCPECATLLVSGSSHYNWKGGVSCEPYCDVWADKGYKRSILERDGYKCKNPMCSGKFSRLSIHHVDYDKKNCVPNNLITLCTSCNSKANYNRDYWQKLYKNEVY